MLQWFRDKACENPWHMVTDPNPSLFLSTSDLQINEETSEQLPQAVIFALFIETCTTSF